MYVRLTRGACDADIGELRDMGSAKACRLCIVVERYY